MSERIIIARPKGSIKSTSELKVGSSIVEVHAFLGCHSSKASLFGGVKFVTCLRFRNEGWWYLSNETQLSESERLDILKKSKNFHVGMHSAKDRNIGDMNGYNSHFLFTNIKDAQSYVDDVNRGKYNSNLSKIDPNDFDLSDWWY
jgi:hypothetical protein